MKQREKIGLVIFIFGITCFAIDVLAYTITGESQAEWAVLLDASIPTIGAIIFLWNDKK